MSKLPALSGRSCVKALEKTGLAHWRPDQRGPGGRGEAVMLCILRSFGERHDWHP
jgi:hypothetical protein